jgi:5-hydroxyisourate hydrolase
MIKITTHVLDVVLGKPASGIAVRLEKQQSARQIEHDGAALIPALWMEIANGSTDADGRCRPLADEVGDGTYRLTFQTGDYLQQRGRNTIYPEVAITFSCGADGHYHLPLLLSDNSYTTYRGS